VPMVQTLPKCPEHHPGLELIRVEISEDGNEDRDRDKIVTDVYGCPSPGCKTEHSSQQGRRTVESGKWQVANGSHRTLDTLHKR
jgi:hypothetical protein